MSERVHIFRVGAHAGLIMSYFRFYIYKAIKKAKINLFMWKDKGLFFFGS